MLDDTGGSPRPIGTAKRSTGHEAPSACVQATSPAIPAPLDGTRRTRSDEEGASGRAGKRKRAARLPDDEDDPQSRRGLGELRDQPGHALPARQPVA
ncbi:MAG: hypothetical protein WB771_07020 [Solirubrobacterales bacterium]